MKMLNKKTVHPNDAQADMQHNDWLNKLKVGTITAATTSLICVSAASHAADLEIYVVPENAVGKTTLMMMLDISGSMGRGRGPAKRLAACDLPPMVTAGQTSNDTASVSHNGFTTTYRRDFCYNSSSGVERRYYFRRTGAGTQRDQYVYHKCGGAASDYSLSNNVASCSGASSNTAPSGFTYASNYYYKDEIIQKYYDRMARMQDAMMAMLNGNATTTKLADDLVIGLSTLGRVGSGNDTGRILVPAQALNTVVNASNNKTQRDKLIETVAALEPISYTPTERAYGETAAYLLGTHTRHGGATVNETWSGITANNNPKGSGFVFSESATKNAAATAYEMPASIEAQMGSSDAARNAKACSGQGIYVLTDGEPENAQDINVDRQLLKQALTTATSTSTYTCTSTWNCLHTFAETLKNPQQNPRGIEIRTEVVGFGSDLGSNGNVKNWAIKGGGKGYFTNDASAVVESVKDFLKDIVKEIPSVSTGSSSIPVDALNPEIIQPYAYFPQFEPKVADEHTQQLWFGNLKKYYVVNHGVYASENGGAANTVVLRGKLQDLRDIWGASSASYPTNTPIYQKHGVLSKLKLGIETVTDGEDSTTTAGRKVLTDYVFDGTKTGDDQISRNFDLVRVDYTYTTNVKTKTDDASRVRGLMALLGYNIPENEVTDGLDLTTRTAILRQMGQIYHSLPVLLAQQGKAVATRDGTGNIHIGTTGREDYVMFGTTQGLLSVVDAETGVEKFSFVPKEMVEKQSETFKENAGSLTGGKEALYYGMDGEWAAHTVYVTKPDGTLTVKEAIRNVIGTEEDKENFKGKQWIYGGMRMGGRSYYALDLTDIDNPSLKFHIDPSSGKVYSKDYPEGKAFSEIENMGQSWSKPKLDYVNWKGQRKLVMFVGGGYDAGGDDGDGLWVDGVRTGYAGYEHYDYQQENRRGAGVYMFDADNGNLLWYADANGSTTPTDPNDGVDPSTGEAIPHLVNNDLKYSVVSEIKTVDRNNDGMVDHIYFGDLAGQAFRVDFARNATKFDSQITKVLDVHQTDGTSPRFYLAPVFTAHHSSDRLEGANVVVVSFVSGNKSSPLLATSDSPEVTGKRDSTGLQYDAVYAIYDYDIHPNGDFYPDSNIAARTLAATTDTTAATTKLMYIGYDSLVRKDQADGNNRARVTGAIANPITGWGGWYFRFDKKFSATGENHADVDASVIKGLVPLIAMEGSLYVTMYDASEDGTSSNCGAGVKGQSFAQRLCLPTGVCAENANYSYNLGAGIVSLNVGSVSGGNTKSIVVPDPDDIGKGCVGADCKTGKNFIEAGGSMRFIPNRWYERYAKR